jgi:TonB family protein
MDANRTTPHYELKSELARCCLPAARREANLKLAWVNSVCLLFLLIGIVGARQGVIAIKPVPPLAQIIPVVVQPVVVPPQATTETKPPENPADNNAPPVAVVIPQAPNINFSVPTIGTLVAPANLSQAPPLEPLRAKAQVGLLCSTGGGGDRPEPSYPVIAKQMGQQGTVVLLLTGDTAGNVVSVEVKSSSGFPVLDRAATDFIKRHWRLPVTGGLFQTSITYQLQF